MRSVLLCVFLVLCNASLVILNSVQLATSPAHHTLYIVGIACWSAVGIINSHHLWCAWGDYRNPMMYVALAWKEFGDD